MARARNKETVFAVVGLGTFGTRICEELIARGGTVIGIDSNPDRVNRVKNTVTQGIVMDATDEEGFAKTSLEDVDIVIVAIGDNIEGSILATALLKQRGIPYLVARAVNPIHKQVLQQIGADEVLNLEEDEGTRLAVRLIAPRILDNTPLSDRISIAEVYCPREFTNQSLFELDLRKKMGINVVGVKRLKVGVGEDGNSHREEELIFPDAEFKLAEDDVLIVVGYNEAIAELKEL